MSNNYVYCTAIIQITGKKSYDETLKEFNLFEKVTQQEEGCISFSVVPMSKEKQKIALREIWQDEDAFYVHHRMKHIVDLASQNLTSVCFFESSHKLVL